MEYPPLSWLGPVPPAAGGERGVLIGEDGLVLSDDVKQVDTTQFNHLHDVVVCWGGEERGGERGEGRGGGGERGRWGEK